MILGVAKLAAGIWQRIGKIIGGIGDWLRADHDWWRIGFFALGFVCLCLSAVIHDRQTALEAARLALTTQRNECAASRALMQTEIDGYKREWANLAEAARREQAWLEAQRQKTAATKAQLAEAEAKAARENAAWQARYNDRPQSCRAAQAALDVACAGLGSY